MIKKYIILFICICIKSISLGQIIIQFHKTIDSIYYRSRTTWIAPGPFAITQQRFSIDSGQTYLRAGIFGQNLKLYVNDFPKAKRQLKIFKITRIIGLAQMLIIGPYFLKKEIDWTNDYNAKYKPPYPDIRPPPYLAFSLCFIYTGAISYHSISKPFFRKSLREYHKSHKLVNK